MQENPDITHRTVILTALLALSVAHAHADQGVRVTGVPGAGGWPFSNVAEGEVICRGWPPAQPAALPTEPPWYVFFRAPGGHLLALNGKAQAAVNNGRVAGRNLHAELQAAGAGAEPFVLMGQWIKAGVALCKGERAEAERLAAEASRVAAE